MLNHLAADPFGERRRSLEEAFFKEKDRQLLDQLRNELSALEDRKKLAHVSGIVEQRVLGQLVQAGVTAETLAAVVMIPIVEVAWVDGSLSTDERDAVLNAAVAQGITTDSASYELLKLWLRNRPDPRIIAAWKEYVTEVARLMPSDAVSEFKRAMIDRATRVAESAGGFLGMATISKSERAKIDELAKACDG
jgi:hypothetical protein